MEEMKQKSDIFLHTSFKQGNTNKEEKVSKIVTAEKDTHSKGQSKKEMLVKGPDQIYQSLQKLHIKKRTVCAPPPPLQTEWIDQSTPKKRGKNA